MSATIAPAPAVTGLTLSRTAASPADYRADITGLRAFVVLVLLFHFDETVLPGGFVVLDLFFVVSGFVITRMIERDLGRGRFTLSGFYYRRARRLLPAFFTMLAVVILLAVLLDHLLQPVFMQRSLPVHRVLGESLVWTAGYASNIHFAGALFGYFAPQARTEPLLHTWSLSVEEQFYLVLPVLLLALRRRRLPVKLAVLGTLAAASMAAGILMGQEPASAMASYYMPHTRAWQFLAGVLLAYAPPPANRRLAEAATLVGLALLALPSLLLHSGVLYPGYAALPSVLGSAGLVWGGGWGPTALGRVLLARPVQWLGQLSYSLYLWHWPLLCLARLYAPPSTPLHLHNAAAAYLLAVLAAWLTHRYVERPFREGRVLADRPGLTVLGFVALTLGFMGTGFVLDRAIGISLSTPPEARAAIRENERVSMYTSFCSQNHMRRFDDPARLHVCEVGVAPATAGAVLVWGDSQAEQLGPALEAMAGGAAGGPAVRRLLMAIHTGCPVLEGFEPMKDGRVQPGVDCSGFNRAALRRALQPDVGVVVISAGWDSLQDERWLPCLRAAPGQDCDRFPSQGAAQAAATAGLSRLVGTLRAAGKEVVLLRPFPRPPGDPVAMINAALRRGLPVPDGRSEPDHRAETAALEPLFRAAAAAGARLLDPAAMLCGHGTCPLHADGRTLYRDPVHVSTRGAMLLAAPLAEAIEAAARQPP